MHGSGAVGRSRNHGSVVLKIDVGGGTTKITLIGSGIIRDMAAINIGARLIARDESNRVIRLESGARRFLTDLGLKLDLGDRVDSDVFPVLAARMAQVLFDAL